MRFNEARKIMMLVEQSRKEIQACITIMGTEAQNHFKTSFRNQGFTDNGLETWQKRKRTRGGEGRAILVKSGTLRRSLRKVRKGALSVSIISNLPYATIHNEGGIIEKKARTHILSFNSKGKFQRQRTEKQRSKTSYMQKAHIGAYKIKIPKRQFVGYSETLHRRLTNKIEYKLRNLIK